MSSELSYGDNSLSVPNNNRCRKRRSINNASDILSNASTAHKIDNISPSQKGEEDRATAATTLSVVPKQPITKKQKVERINENNHLYERRENSGFNDSNDCFGIPTHDTFDEDHNIKTIRLPKVSMDSVGNSGCNGSDSNVESEDIIIDNSLENETNPLDNNKDEESDKDDDDSDIVCLGTSSESQIMDRMLSSREKEKMDGIDLFDDNKSDHYQSDDLDPGNREDSVGNEDESCTSGDQKFAAPIAVSHQQQKDVCYICGSDLTRLKGLQGRVAHMKRCSAKYGTLLPGPREEDDSTDFVEESCTFRASPQKDGGVNNPYSKRQWHGDADSELELNKSTQQKQSMLKTFFKAPVRSLTHVLMSGARQVAKGKAITNNSATSPKYGKQSNRKGGHWGSNNARRNGYCPAYKRITGTDFICDGFYYACSALSGNYFLTHFHSDHYGGITKTWNYGTIYCSLPTANLVHSQLGVDKKYLHPISMDTPTVIASQGRPVTVTLLNANHCPGAIMFLFEVGKRNILHVGDFRWNQDVMLQMPQLRAFSNNSTRLDELYLDTTYCNKKYTLPTQADAINAAIEVAEKEMAMSNKDKKMKTLFLFGS